MRKSEKGFGSRMRRPRDCRRSISDGAEGGSRGASWGLAEAVAMVLEEGQARNTREGAVRCRVVLVLAGTKAFEPKRRSSNIFLRRYNTFQVIYLTSGRRKMVR